jgi:serine/threonine protein kinase
MTALVNRITNLDIPYVTELLPIALSLEEQNERVQEVIAAMNSRRNGGNTVEPNVRRMLGQMRRVEAPIFIAKRRPSETADTKGNPVMDCPLLLTPDGNFILLTSKRRGFEQIGVGRAKKVKTCVDEHLKICALAVCRELVNRPVAWASALSEVDNMRKMKGRSRVIQLTTACLRKTDKGNKLYIVMDLCNRGDVLNAIRNEAPAPRLDRLTRKEILQLLSDSAEGVAQIHEAGLTHNDLSAPNVLLRDEEGRVRAVIGDLGFACDEREMSVEKLRRYTPTWSSPEKAQALLNNHQRSDDAAVLGLRRATTQQSDIFSLGLIAFALVSTGQPLDHQCGNEELEELELELELLESTAKLTDSEIDRDIQRLLGRAQRSPELQMIRRMLSVDPRNRPSANDAFQEFQHLLWQVVEQEKRIRQRVSLAQEPVAVQPPPVENGDDLSGIKEMFEQALNLN